MRRSFYFRGLSTLLSAFLLTRACIYSTLQIADKLSCRMPLPYTHFVQVLVDTFVALSPFALYADLGVYSIFSVGKWLGLVRLQ